MAVWLPTRKGKRRVQWPLARKYVMVKSDIPNTLCWATKGKLYWRGWFDTQYDCLASFKKGMDKELAKHQKDAADIFNEVFLGRK